MTTKTKTTRQDLKNYLGSKMTPGQQVTLHLKNDLTFKRVEVFEYDQPEYQYCDQLETGWKQDLFEMGQEYVSRNVQDIDKTEVQQYGLVFFKSKNGKMNLDLLTFDTDGLTELVNNQ